MNEQDIQNIVRAIQSTPEMQWVQQQMRGGAQQPQPGQQPPGMQPQHSTPPPHQQMGAPQMGQQPQRYEKAEDPTAMEVENYVSIDKYTALEDRLKTIVDQYSQLGQANAKMVDEYGQMRKAVVQLEQRAVDAERLDRIRDLYQKFQHFVKVDEEREICLYSHGSTMNDEEFAKHLVQVENYALRSSPVTTMLPGGANGHAMNLSDKEKYATALNDAVVDRYQKLADRGEFKSYEEIESLVKQEMGLAKP